MLCMYSQDGRHGQQSGPVRSHRRKTPGNHRSGEIRRSSPFLRVYQAIPRKGNRKIHKDRCGWDPECRRCPPALQKAQRDCQPNVMQRMNRVVYFVKEIDSILKYIEEILTIPICEIQYIC